ncbi:DUF202 domain-containing protein [Vibrio campbellii]|uniref:DUF202 domain-containing protein n=1 Tax=Vibrio campbellii TaxID=680 RepID=UPI00142E8267|nr:DUF202 domain-containing protein [Vibrio campbellii]NIY86091.1 DUF202 domain-containing protein [Vibrio campbellii]NVK68172.1 DUF202 domain-containing protein [Vibrio campbellii]
MSLLDETKLKSDAGLQVERTVLSWLRTLFVSALIVLSIAKILHGSISWLLAVSLVCACLACRYVYASGLCVATRGTSWKAGKHKVIAITVALSALLFGVHILIS